MCPSKPLRAPRGVEIFIRREFGEASDIEYQLATHVEARGGVAGPLEMKGGVRVKRASVRRCSSTLLMLGMASPLLFVLGTGRMPGIGGSEHVGREPALIGHREVATRESPPAPSAVPIRMSAAQTAPETVTARENPPAPDAPVAISREDGHRIVEEVPRMDAVPEMASVDSDSDSGADSDADAADPDFYDDDTGPKTGMSDEQCEVLANDWIASRDELLAKRMASGKSDMLFFLHVPRTAGRTYHFCYLKLAYPEARRCARSYDALRVNVDDPKCEFLASHDDYSLVERFHQQPKVVTMLRDPVARFLSSYEFAVEVSVRSFGQEIKVSSSRVATRDVWPWSDAVRYIDKQLKDYKHHVEGNGKKDSIVNVYNNSVYTPLHLFADTQEAHDDFHNGQFLQLLGITTNSNPETEPQAARLRGCLRKGSAATEALYRFAERRLRDEIDVVVVHERLDRSLQYSSAAMGTHMHGPSYNDAPPPPKFSLILKERLESRAAPGEGLTIVAFAFRFEKLAGRQLEKKEWRDGYVTAVKSVLSYVTGVGEDRVAVEPLQHGDWRSEGGFQVAIVEYPAGGAPASKTGPRALRAKLEAAIDARENAIDLVNAAEGFDAYGDLWIHGVGARTASDGVDVYKLGKDPRWVPLGQAFRTCERQQRNKYARLKNKAFKSLHKHVEGDFEPFLKDDRLQISEELKDHVRELNYLDERLHKAAIRIFDERAAAREDELAADTLPPKLTR